MVCHLVSHHLFYFSLFFLPDVGYFTLGFLEYKPNRYRWNQECEEENRKDNTIKGRTLPAIPPPHTHTKDRCKIQTCVQRTWRYVSPTYCLVFSRCRNLERRFGAEQEAKHPARRACHQWVATEVSWQFQGQAWPSQPLCSWTAIWLLHGACIPAIITYHETMQLGKRPSLKMCHCQHDALKPPKSGAKQNCSS